MSKEFTDAFTKYVALVTNDPNAQTTSAVHDIMMRLIASSRIDPQLAGALCALMFRHSLLDDRETAEPVDNKGHMPKKWMLEALEHTELAKTMAPSQGLDAGDAFKIVLTALYKLNTAPDHAGFILGTFLFSIHSVTFDKAAADMRVKDNLN